MIVAKPIYFKVEGNLSENFHWVKVKEIMEELVPKVYFRTKKTLRKDGEYLKDSDENWYFKPYNKSGKIVKNPVMEF